ncbi:hypothetical protein [Phenylobacterium ferrooxidans]|uniref:Uncharacterized protein n=1 Tax=Phenylobacterium ferrooxidans TaxID=2982689 RepID=A0ABW6CN50_9CAUL
MDNQKLKIAAAACQLDLARADFWEDVEEMKPIQVGAILCEADDVAFGWSGKFDGRAMFSVLVESTPGVRTWCECELHFSGHMEAGEPLIYCMSADVEQNAEA